VTFLLHTTSKPKISYADLAQIFSTTTPTLSEVSEAVRNIRSKKFPDWRLVGTAGSFFKNPIIKKSSAEHLRSKYPELPLHAVSDDETKVSLGYILDKVCNLKGFRVDKVGLSPAQALVLINYGDATAAEITSFVTEIKKIVFEKTNLVIECEVQFI
jgi:UDP-N-acetylmuramate dehydrogenase